MLQLKRYPNPSTFTKYQKIKLLRTYRSVLMLHLIDSVMRECDGLEIVAELWKKLDDFYPVKTPPNKLYLLKRLFSFKINMSKELHQNLDEFNKIVLDLVSCNIKFEDDQLDVILLLALPESFDNLINVIEYGRDTLTKEIMINSIKYHDFKSKMKGNTKGEGLSVRGT